MEAKRTIQEDLVSLKILNKRDGIYCMKEDMCGDALKFAFITSDAMKLAIWEVSENPSVEMYDWNENEIESHEKIVDVLSELAFKPLFQEGTPAEKNEAIEMWQPCSDMALIPSNFVDYINNLKNNSK